VIHVKVITITALHLVIQSLESKTVYQIMHMNIVYTICKTYNKVKMKKSMYTYTYRHI